VNASEAALGTWWRAHNIKLVPMTGEGCWRFSRVSTSFVSVGAIEGDLIGAQV